MRDKDAIREAKIRIRRLFLKEWDPIGIGDEPRAQDEYDSYLEGMYALLSEGASETEVVKYLYKIETESMGMKGRKGRLLPVARKLRALNLRS